MQIKVTQEIIDKSLAFKRSGEYGLCRNCIIAEALKPHVSLPKQPYIVPLWNDCYTYKLNFYINETEQIEGNLLPNEVASIAYGFDHLPNFHDLKPTSFRLSAEYFMI